MKNERILIVEDEAAIRDMVSAALELNGFDCIETENGLTAHQIIVDDRPDLVLLDWMLPGISGVELARRLKRDESTKEIPIIILTAKGEEDNKIQGLEAGADDYVTKPFSIRELISRVNAVLRRTNPYRSDKNLEILGLQIEPISRRVIAHGAIVTMGPTEYRLLEFFMLHQDRAYTRSQLLDQVWGGNIYVEDRTIDVHIRRLRKALEPYQFDHFIQTVRGTGYRFSGKTDTENKVESL